ncbi:uncharacterized protein DS421_1g19470 [Arachis hypogaea]|nr:uncharacterized protein DS421_1g19470 [Arachis hypogaea]
MCVCITYNNTACNFLNEARHDTISVPKKEADSTTTLIPFDNSCEIIVTLRVLFHFRVIIY